MIKKLFLTAIQNNSFPCKHSLLKGYKRLAEIVEKEGEYFLLSCYNNKEVKIRLQVINHHSFITYIKTIRNRFKR